VTLLSGIQVLSTAINVPGPVAAKTLRDMGATVVKVEPPAGDPLAIGAPAWYRELHEGVEVHRVDLKSDDGRLRFHTWLEQADVMITATRPASLHRLGLSWHTLHARYPRLCHVAVVGYPAPRHDEAGHDLTYQADAGLLAPPSMPRTLIADLAGAQLAVSAALAVLLARERGGASGHQEIALSDAAALFAMPLRHGLTAHTGWLGGGTAAYGIYAARDGWIGLAALEPHFRDALAKALNVDITDRRVLERMFAERNADEWQRWGIEHGVPLSAVR
jgi:alpha-methylacyl-CoA racemase